MKINYINGITLATWRKIAAYAFMEWFVYAKFSPSYTIDIYIKEGFDEEAISYFKSFWGGSVTIYQLTEAQSQAFDK